MCSINDATEEDDKIYYQNIRNRCGEIFFEDDKLKYYCLFCQADFGKISNFTIHLYKTHLYMEPPLFDDVKTETVNKDYNKSDNNKNKIYINDQSIEIKDISSITEINEDQKYITKEDIVDDETIYLSKLDNNIMELNNDKVNLLTEFKVDIFEIDMKNVENPTINTDVQQNQCKLCFKILSSERSLKRHHLTHTKDTQSNIISKNNFPKGEDDRFHCNLCSNNYSRIDTLRRHIKRHWGSTNHAKCEICSKILSSKVHLKAHMRVHTGERPHKCHYCPAAFADRTNFDRHLRIHLGDKRYHCDFCEKTFIQRSEKKIHERMVHTKERPYQCEFCGKKFFNGVTLNDHKKRHTNTRPFECDTCGKRFYNRKLLKDHKISHSNEKPHTCDICSAKFARRKALRQHLKIHSSVKEYVCTICNKAFAQNAGLYSHMKSHTGNLQTSANANVST